VTKSFQFKSPRSNKQQFGHIIIKSI